MSTMTEDGRQVIARGRIRVDARRALAKLREHLLVDLHLYATEIARAAIAAKSTFLDVEYDTDDVILTFDGAPIAPTELPRLLDHVLGDGQSTDRVLRSLALGVNAALGLDPSYVDIYVRTPDVRQASKVRFVPSVLQSEESALPDVVMVTPPKDLPERSMRVHIRRRMTVGLLKRAATRELPREIVLLTESLHCAPLSLTSHGAPMPLSPRQTTLLRVPIERRELRRSVLEIVSAPASPSVDFLELGVLLLQKPFVTEPVLPSTPHAQIELPIRVTIDADELPTNASRSAIREDSLLTTNAEQSARDALNMALGTLVALVAKQGKPLPGVEILEHDPKKLEDALGAIVCVVAGAFRRGEAISEQARALLELPLLQNAVGLPIAPITILENTSGDVCVHNGKEPFPRELQPWLDDVVWLRGKSVERILADFGLQDAKARVAAAEVAQARRSLLHARPASDPVVPPDDGHVVKDTFHIHDGPFKGLRGQLALGAEGQRTGQRPSSIRIFVEGRHIDTLTIDRDKLPLSVDAAIAWEKRLLPKFSYEGVIDNDSLRLAIFQLTRLSLLALGTYFERSLEQKRSADERALVLPVARAAIGAFANAAKSLQVDKVPVEPPLHAYTGIWARGIWASANTHRLPVSLAELKTYSDRTKAICFVPPGSSGVAPDGRPVVVLTDLEKKWLESVFPDVTFIPYARALLPKADERIFNVAMFDSLRSPITHKSSPGERLPSMAFEERDIRGVIAPHDEDRLLSLHAGVLLANVVASRFVEPALVVLEHDATVPKPTWDGIHWAREHSSLTLVHNELLQRIVGALEGDLQARQELRDFPDHPGPILRSYLIEAAARFRGKDLGQRIEKLPLVQILDENTRPKLCSLADLTARFAGDTQIPFLRTAPPFPTFEWHPVFVPHDREMAAMRRWAGNRFQNAEGELDKRSRLALVQMRRQTFLATPKIQPTDPNPLADPEVPPRVWQEQPSAEGAPVAFAVAALPRIGIELPFAVAEILYQDRLVCSKPVLGLSVPVVVRVFLPSDTDIVNYADVSPSGLTVVEKCAYACACALAADLVTRANGDAWALFFHDRRVLLLIRSLFACSVDNPTRSDILLADFALRSSDFLWPTVQGEYKPHATIATGGKKLFYASVRYEQWEQSSRSRSELDEPIVFIPATSEGDLVRDILTYMGHELTNVTDAVMTLQQRRRPGVSVAGPALTGTAVHPALRVSLASVGVEMDGEIEIIDGSTTTVHVETLGGSNVTLDVKSPIAFQAIVRVEDVEMDEPDKTKLAEKLAKAAVKHLESLADRIHELPAFVRSSLRIVVVKFAAKGRNLSKRRQKMPVFLDIFGEFHSIADLAGDGSAQCPYVTIVLPHPVSRRVRPPIYLHPDEVSILANHLALENVTESLQREIKAQERRRAAQVAFIGLNPEQRLACLDVVPYATNEELHLDGQVGILAPEYADQRGIWVHKDRRPLCKIADSGEWPLLAVINDDEIAENKAFDGIKGSGPKERLRQRVLARAAECMQKWFVAPTDCLVSRKIEPTAVGESLVVMGALWLPPSWTTSGMVEVRDETNRFFTMRAFIVPDATAIDGTIAICGRLFIAPKSAKKNPSARTDLIAWGLQQAAGLVLDAQEIGDNLDALAPYQWLLRLLGADVGELSVTAADGRTIDAAEVLSTLTSRNEIWVTRGEGDIDGKFPAGMPPFILRDDGHPLVQVLRARTKSVRDFAIVRKNPPIVLPTRKARKVAVDVALEEPSPIDQSFEPQGFVGPDDQGTEIDVVSSQDEQVSWFRSLVQKVVVFFDRPEPLEPWTEALGPSLVAAIDKLGLTSVCVLKAVRYVRKGRPMSFESWTGELVINRSHPAIRSLAARVGDDPRARLVLVVAAVREINRVLEVVTDATEQRVLMSLLRGEPV